MDTREAKLRLFEALLDHRGIQRVLDVAAGLLGNPVFICDMGLSVLCRSSSEGVEDPAWSDDEDKWDVIRSTADAGIFERLYGSDAALLGQFEGNPTRYLGARIRDGANVIGHAVVLDQFRPFEDADYDILPVVCQTVAFTLRKHGDGGYQTIGYGSALNDLLTGASSDPGHLRDALKHMQISLPNRLRVLMVRRLDESIVSSTFLRLQLLNAFPGSIGIVAAGDNLHVVDGEMSKGGLEDVLVKRIYLGGCVVGCSRSFSDWASFGSAFLQADAAVRLSSTGKEGPVRHYDDVEASYLREVALRSLPAALADNDALLRLEEMDAAEGTSYVETVWAYLCSGRSITRAARMLYLHKNSLYHRLRRMRELLGIDIEDEPTCFSLQLALAMRGRPPVST